MKHKKIFFDFDGTLVDSGEGIMNSASYALSRIGIPVPPQDELREFVGPPLTTSFPRFGVPEERVDEAVAYYRDMYNNGGGKYQVRLYPGTETLLCRLKEAGFEMYIATSKPEALAEEISERFGISKYISIIAGATLDRKRESKSAVIEYLIDSLEDKSTDGTVMVGDTAYDVIGASEEGLPCIGVSWGYGKAEDIIAAGASALASSPEELYEILVKF